MHVCHLGCDLWVVGNSLKTILLDTDLWGSGCDDERLLNGWLEFKQWARTNKWQPFGCTYFKLALFWTLLATLDKPKKIT